jgi:hypothetical protein
MLGVLFSYGCGAVSNKSEADQAKNETSDGVSGDIAYAPGEVLVRFREGVEKSEISALLERYGLQIIKQYKIAPLYHLRLPEGMSVNAALEKLRSEAAVEYAEPNIQHRLIAPVNGRQIK